MDVNAFATTRTAAAPAERTSVTAQGQALSGGQGVFSGLGGLNFFDMIFAHIAEGQDLKNEIEGAATALSVPISDSDPSLEILNQFLDLDASNDIDPLIGTANPEASGVQPLTDSPPDLLKQLRAYLDTLLQGLPAEQQHIKANAGEFQEILTGMQREGDPSLIATGLSPDDLASLLNLINSSGEIEASHLLSTVTLIPPPATENKPVLFLSRALIAIQEQAQNGQVSVGNEAAPQTASLSKLIAGGATAPSAADTSSVIPGGVSLEEGVDFPRDLENALDRPEETSGNVSGSKQKMPSDLGNAAGIIQNKQASAGLSTVTSPMAGSIETMTAWQEIFPEGVDPLNIGIHGKPLTMTSTVTATSLVTNAPQATYPHPATQAVAVTISKMSAHTDDQAFTIKLDPPELGRVEVKMMIDKHNAVKAHLVIEKPETFLMLQRDAHFLERSLQGIGLETGDGSGLSFELAQDNMFRNEGERGGERYQSDRASAIEKIDDDGVIESTMTWRVDPETGMQHYDILA